MRTMRRPSRTASNSGRIASVRAALRQRHFGRQRDPEESRSHQSFHVLITSDEVRREAKTGAYVAEDGRKDAGGQQHLRRILIAFHRSRALFQRQCPRLTDRSHDGRKVAARQAAQRLQVALLGWITAGDFHDQIVAHDGPRRAVGARGSLLAPVKQARTTAKRRRSSEPMPRNLRHFSSAAGSSGEAVRARR